MRGLERGFTLVELVVTLLVLALAASVAVPAFRPEEARGDLDRAVEAFEDLLRAARDSAVAAAVPVTLSIDSITGGVWVTTPADRAAGGPQEAAAIPFPLPPSVRVELGRARARFAFQPGGSAFADTVVLRGSTGVRVLTLNPWTGHAIVH